MKPIECEGAPRDLGRDQGCALGEAIRASAGVDTASRRLLALRPDTATTRLRRDLRRYFPHQAEWLEGMARGARVPQRSLLRALVASAGPDAPPPAVIATAGGSGVCAAVPVPPRAVLRMVRPEGRFASVEIALPVASSPIAGVNEVGLAVAVVPRGWLPGRFAAPFGLFARDCLERFDSVEPALEWCLSRPAARGGAILLADARGEMIGVDASGPRRRPVVASGGWLALGNVDKEPPAWLKRGELADLEELASALTATLASEAPGTDAVLLLDPARRRLRVAGGDWSVGPTGAEAR